MSLNEHSRIVPLSFVNEILDREAEQGAELLDGYDRVQLLTEEGYHFLVEEGHDRSYIVYGELSRDFPICSDFSNICASYVARLAIKRGLAVRPCFGRVDYTKTERNKVTQKLKRHSINYCVTVEGRVLWFEPLNGLWLPKPEKLMTLDKFFL